MTDKQADKAMTRLDRIIDKIADRFPSSFPENVNVDVAKLTQMGLAGGSAYIFADTLVSMGISGLEFIRKLYEELGLTLPKGGKVPYWFWGLMGGGLLGALAGEELQQMQEVLQGVWDWITGAKPSEDLSDEEWEIIESFELTETQKIAIAFAVAAVFPMAPEIIKGLGDIVKGIGEIIPG